MIGEQIIRDIVNKMYGDIGFDFSAVDRSSIRNAEIVLVKDDGSEEIIRNKILSDSVEADADK